MLAYAFRFIDDDGVPTGRYGTAIAENKLEMFWEIDQYGDPYSVEVISIQLASVCFSVVPVVDEFDEESVELDIEECPPEFDDRTWYRVMGPDTGWRKPVWPDIYKKVA